MLLKGERKNIKRHILAKELSGEDKIKFLTNPSKQLIDTIKIVCCRAETAMALTLKEQMSRTCDTRSLLQGIYKNEADLIPDTENENVDGALTSPGKSCLIGINKVMKSHNIFFL